MFPSAKLKVWQKAHHVGVAIVRAVPFHRGWAHPVAIEAMRTACSVTSNIAEGAGSDSPKQFARYLGIARASAYELEAQLLLARDGEVFATDLASKLLDETVEVKRMLVVLQRRVGTSSSGRSRAATLPPR